MSIPEDRTQSVYTKEMHDAGELPKVGMLCQFNKHEYFYIGIDSCGGNVFERVGYHNEYKVFRLRDIKPVDARTQAEKDKDELLETVREYMKVHNAKDFIDEVISGNFKHIKYTGKDND